MYMNGNDTNTKNICELNFNQQFKVYAVMVIEVKNEIIRSEPELMCVNIRTF